jgi:hypothetical protein
MKSRPCVNARAHSEGDETSDIDISLAMLVYSTCLLDESDLPGLRHLLADIHRLRKYAEARTLRKVNITLLRT